MTYRFFGEVHRFRKLLQEMQDHEGVEEGGKFSIEVLKGLCSRIDRSMSFGINKQILNIHLS